MTRSEAADLHNHVNRLYKYSEKWLLITYLKNTKTLTFPKCKVNTGKFYFSGNQVFNYAGNTLSCICSDWKTLENQSANLQTHSGLEWILSKHLFSSGRGLSSANCSFIVYCKRSSSLPTSSRTNYSTCMEQTSFITSKRETPSGKVLFDQLNFLRLTPHMAKSTPKRASVEKLCPRPRFTLSRAHSLLSRAISRVWPVNA